MESIPAILAYASRTLLSGTTRPPRDRAPRRRPRARSFALAAGLACAAALAPVARAGVVVVDPHGAVGSSLLRDALTAAHDGDILLLRPGDYHTLQPGPYDVGGKSLSLVADGGGTPIVLPAVRVQDLPADGSVWLRGLELRPAAGGFSSGLYVLGCEGVVVAEECTLVGGPSLGAPLLPAGCGLLAVGSARVVLSRCSLQGGEGASPPPGGGWVTPGGAGAILQTSSAALFDCEVRGGRGGDGDTILVDPDGGPGVWLLEGHVVASGCALSGGDEGVSSVIAAQSGSGLIGVTGTPFEDARLRDTSVTAGAVNGLGTPAPDIALPPSSVVIDPAAARSLALPAPLRAHQAASITLGGLPGDMVFVLAAAEPDWKLDAPHQAVLAVDLPVVPVVVATITDASGQAVLPFTTPELPPAVVGGLVLALQAVHFGSDGVTLGAPASAVWIDDAF